MFYFSYRQEVYDEVKESRRRYLAWRNEEKVWNYKNCNITVVGMAGNKARIVVRRKKYGYSEFMQSDFELNLMMGFIALDVKKQHNTDSETTHLVFEIEQSQDKNHRDLKDVQIWSDDGSEVDSLYDTIMQRRGNESNTEIIESDHMEKHDSMVPVIYQPRVDAWKNFLREVHVHEYGNSFQITLVFQDEVLRRHRFLDAIYRLFRLLKYKRIVDIETFSFKEGQFFFDNIYSAQSNLFDDNVHNRKTILPKYYFQNNNHPVIFVNTSNHALAPHDNNHDFWKWEYVPWSKKVPVKLGNKTRQEVERMYRR